MKHPLFMLIISAMMLSPVFLWASYPELSGVRDYERPEIDQGDLEQFTAIWDVPGIQASEAAEQLSGLVSQSPQLQQLQALYDLQELHYRNSADDSGLNLSLSTDPVQTPAYRYSYFPSSASPTAHTFGLNTAASLNLATGGTLELKAGSTSTASYGSDWSWKQSPSFSLSVQQPLGAGEGLIDTEYAGRQLESLRISRDQAGLNARQLRRNLILQGLSLISASQDLEENLWLLKERIKLSRDEISRLHDDVKRGTANLSDLREQQIALEQQLLTRTELSYELEIIELSLLQLFGQGSFEQFQLSPSSEILKDASRIFELTDEYLDADPEYQRALLELRKLRTASSMNSLSDAPRLGVSLSYAPGSGAGSSTFGASFADLSWNDPEISLTVTFQAPDLTRKASSLKESTDRKQLDQAESELRVQEQRVKKNLEQLKNSLEKEYVSLGIAMQEYRLAADAYEQEHIRYESGSSSRLDQKRFELDKYAAAFEVLSRMRSLDLLWYETESLLQ